MQRKTLLCAILAASALFTACKKENDNNTDQLASLGKATITGNVYATLVDTSGAPADQAAPANTVINAWIDTKDFIVNPTSGNYANRYYTTTVDANGNYKLVVDVSKYKGATVYITPQQFTHGQVRDTFTATKPDSIFTVQRTFSPVMQTTTQSVFNDVNAIVDLRYN